MATYLADVARCTAAFLSVAADVAPCCAECQSIYGLDAGAMEVAELTDDGGYSSLPCDTCGESDAGIRYSGHAFDHAGELHHLTLCADCLCYFGSGYIPPR